MTKKIYNLKRSTPEQIKLLLTFAKMVRLTRKQMAKNDNRRSTNGLNVAIRKGIIKPDNIKRIIKAERKRLNPFLKERDTAAAYHKIQALSPVTPDLLATIIVSSFGGKEGSVAARMREHGPTLEEKKVVCEHQEKIIREAFKLVEDLQWLE